MVCPCGFGDRFDACCGRFHASTETPATAALLMRSRFSAFAVADPDYLIASWHPSTRPAALDLDAGTRWTRLEILDVRAGGPFDQNGTVEFRAHFRTEDGPGVLRERSEFARTGGRWLYVGGKLVGE
jgi:SEC-C motif-containing protein